MMFASLVVCLCLGTSLIEGQSGTYTGYKVLRITPINDGQVKFLADLEENPQGMELDFWVDASHVGKPVDINVSPRDMAQLVSMLNAQGLTFSVFIKDVQKDIDEETQTGNSHAYGFSGFDYGQYHTYASIQNELRDISQQYNSITTLFSVGNSYKGKRMDAIKISTDKNAGKEVVFIDCGIHAREWISPATCMFFLNKVVSTYQSDANIRRALSKYDIVVLPVFNVDGYEYTHVGKRLWRKTRSSNGHSNPSCVGADPNRNWNFKWGGVGTSSNPCRDTYHGRSAFSEIEVLNVARYLHGIRRQLKSYYNIHAYSQMWMTPWSYTSTLPGDYREIERVALAGINALTARYGTRYTHGPPPKLLYAVSGGSIDWTYGNLGVRYSYALELRDKGQHGFLLPASQIIPTGEETTAGLIAAINAMK